MSLHRDIILKLAQTNPKDHIIFWETDTTGGSGWPFKLGGCWCVCSLLVQPPLSHLLLLISMETGPGVFSHIRTLAINQQVRPGSIPTHPHRSDEHKGHTHTHTHTELNHRNIQSSLAGSPPHLSSQWITPASPYFCLSKPTAFSDVSIVASFFFFCWYNYCFHYITKHKETCSHQLFTFILVGMIRQGPLWEFVI